MPILKLASSKISAELMERLKQFTELSGVNQSAAIRQAIEQFLDNAESTGLAQLTRSEGSFKPSELVARLEAVDCRLLEVETRLRAVEGRSPSSPPPEPIAVVTTEPQAKESPPPPPPDGKPLADSAQWLLTGQAWKLAQSRGYSPGYASFYRHSKAHPDRLDTLGLRFLGFSKPGDAKNASFEDLLWGK